jgi:hypothetical protein
MVFQKSKTELSERKAWHLKNPNEGINLEQFIAKYLT